MPRFSCASGQSGALLDAGPKGFRGAAMVAALQAQVAEPEPNVFQIRILRQQPRVQPLGFVLGALLVKTAARLCSTSN